jgi:hypothetical protein
MILAIGAFTLRYYLEHVAKLTDRLEIVPTHQGARQGEERFMNARTPFVSQSESTESVQPRERAFDDPSRAPQSAPVWTAPFGQLAGDPAPRQFIAMPLRVVPAVALHESRLSQRSTRATTQRGNAVDERQQLGYVVPVRRREARDNRNPVGVGKNMMFRPGLTAIGRVRSSFFPPRSARSEALSTTARARSSWPRRRNSESKTRWSRFQTPTRCHRTRRRQHVLPEPQPISLGSIFQGMPLRSTKRIPVNTARSGIGFRPACWRLRARRFGNSGSIRVHKSSSTSAWLMPDRLAVGQVTVPTPSFEYKRPVS